MIGRAGLQPNATLPDEAVKNPSTFHIRTITGRKACTTQQLANLVAQASQPVFGFFTDSDGNGSIGVRTFVRAATVRER